MITVQKWKLYNSARRGRIKIPWTVAVAVDVVDPGASGCGGCWLSWQMEARLVEGSPRLYCQSSWCSSGSAWIAWMRLLLAPAESGLIIHLLLAPPVIWAVGSPVLWITARSHRTAMSVCENASDSVSDEIDVFSSTPARLKKIQLH